MEKSVVPAPAVSRQAFPGIHAKVMMIAARRNKRRLVAIKLLQLKAQHAAIEIQRFRDIRHFQVTWPMEVPAARDCSLVMIFSCNQFCYADRANPGHNQVKAVDDFPAGLEFAARKAEMKDQLKE